MKKFELHGNALNWAGLAVTGLGGLLTLVGNWIANRQTEELIDERIAAVLGQQNTEDDR